jgi:hypothetical protein
MAWHGVLDLRRAEACHSREILGVKPQRCFPILHPDIRELLVMMPWGVPKGGFMMRGVHLNDHSSWPDYLTITGILAASVLAVWMFLKDWAGILTNWQTGHW